MPKNVIKIDLPTTQIDFQIGSKTFSISLADKSRARINKKYAEISKNEDEQTDSTELVISRYQDVVDSIEKEQKDRRKSKNPMTNEEKTSRIKEAVAKFQKMVEDNGKKLTEYSEGQSIAFLDYIFGDGVGKELYDLVDQSTIALSKIIFQVMTEFNRENDMFEYKDTYMRKKERFKNQQNKQKKNR